MTVSRVGQATFFSSLQLSFRYRRTPVSTMGMSLRSQPMGWRRVRRWQGRQDSNLQPLVLETSALPIELHPSGRPRLLRLPVQLVLPAARAELVQLHAPRVVSLVLARAVRALFADGARQRDHGSVLGLGHGLVI